MKHLTYLSISTLKDGSDGKVRAVCQKLHTSSVLQPSDDEHVLMLLPLVF